MLRRSQRRNSVITVPTNTSTNVQDVLCWAAASRASIHTNKRRAVQASPTQFPSKSCRWPKCLRKPWDATFPSWKLASIFQTVLKKTITSPPNWKLTNSAWKSSKTCVNFCANTDKSSISGKRLKSYNDPSKIGLGWSQGTVSSMSSGPWNLSSLRVAMMSTARCCTMCMKKLWFRKSCPVTTCWPKNSKISLTPGSHSFRVNSGDRSVGGSVWKRLRKDRERRESCLRGQTRPQMLKWRTRLI